MPSPIPPETRGGLVFAVRGRPFFLSAELAIKVAPRPQIARLPGAPPGLLGLALSDGAILPLLEIGPDRSTMIVCVHRGEPVGLVGAEDIQSGVFPAGEAGGVRAGGASVPPFHLEETYARAHAATWGASWGG
jgi:hypothetical protein